MARSRRALSDAELEDLLVRGIEEWWDKGREKGLLSGQLHHHVYKTTGHEFHDDTVVLALSRLEEAGRVRGVDAIHPVVSMNLGTGETGWRGARMRRYFPAGASRTTDGV